MVTRIPKERLEQLRKEIELEKLQREVDKFNTIFKVGDPIVYYEILGQKEPPLRTTTRTKAEILSGHTAVVWLEDKAGCVACSHCFSVAEIDMVKELAKRR
jgi:hypothetical protein